MTAPLPTASSPEPSREVECRLGELDEACVSLAAAIESLTRRLQAVIIPVPVTPSSTKDQPPCGCPLACALSTIERRIHAARVQISDLNASVQL